MNWARLKLVWVRLILQRLQNQSSRPCRPIWCQKDILRFQVLVNTSSMAANKRLSRYGLLSLERVMFLWYSVWGLAQQIYSLCYCWPSSHQYLVRTYEMVRSAIARFTLKTTAIVRSGWSSELYYFFLSSIVLLGRPYSSTTCLTTGKIRDLDLLHPPRLWKQGATLF